MTWSILVQLLTCLDVVAVRQADGIDVKRKEITVYADEKSAKKHSR